MKIYGLLDLKSSLNILGSSYLRNMWDYPVIDLDSSYNIRVNNTNIQIKLWLNTLNCQSVLGEFLIGDPFSIGKLNAIKQLIRFAVLLLFLVKW